MGAPPELVSGPARAVVPASSANLGPGFDALGLALTRHDDLTARITDEPGVRVTVAGEGADVLDRGEGHLVAVAMAAAFDRMGAEPVGFVLDTVNRIPHGRGLGSSAAAIVAGVSLARALVVDGDDLLPDPAALALAAELEGHPDNVAAALLGGFTTAWTGDDGVARAVRRAVHPGIVPVVCVPEEAVATRTARALLPSQVPHADAAFNAGRTALLVTALTTDPALLLPATDDRLHQPYRAAAMPASAALVVRLRSAGIPAVVSGAGPTVLALASAETAGQVMPLAAGFAVHRLEVDPAGVRVERPAAG